MLASVIIPLKNGGPLFKKVLHAVLNQKISGKYEVIIIDSGSTDGSFEYVETINDERVRVLEIAPEKFCHGKTRNLGASRAKGKFLVFLTHDALPVDDLWLANLLKVFDMDNDIAGVFGKHIPYEDSDIFEKKLLKQHFLNFGSSDQVFHIEDKERYSTDERYRHFLCFYSDNSSAMRKSIWEEEPYPDIDFAEDQLWAKKILELGYKKGYAADSVVFHSHRYTFREQFKRYYDDYKGLYKVYKYIPVKNFLFLPYYILGHTAHDYLYLWRNYSRLGIVTFSYWCFYSIVKNCNRYLGGYFGVKGAKYDFLNRFFSREYLLRKNYG